MSQSTHTKTPNYGTAGEPAFNTQPRPNALSDEACEASSVHNEHTQREFEFDILTSPSRSRSRSLSPSPAPGTRHSRVRSRSRSRSRSPSPINSIPDETFEEHSSSQESGIDDAVLWGGVPGMIPQKHPPRESAETQFDSARGASRQSTARVRMNVSNSNTRAESGRGQGQGRERGRGRGREQEQGQGRGRERDMRGGERAFPDEDEDEIEDDPVTVPEPIHENYFEPPGADDDWCFLCSRRYDDAITKNPLYQKLCNLFNETKHTSLHTLYRRIQSFYNAYFRPYQANREWTERSIARHRNEHMALTPRSRIEEMIRTVTLQMDLCAAQHTRFRVVGTDKVEMDPKGTMVLLKLQEHMLRLIQGLKQCES